MVHIPHFCGCTSITMPKFLMHNMLKAIMCMYYNLECPYRAEALGKV